MLRDHSDFRSAVMPGNKDGVWKVGAPLCQLENPEIVQPSSWMARP